MFDAVSYLKTVGIEYHLPGDKNVSTGWVGIRCLYCSDKSWHLGINVGGEYCRCWRCGGPDGKAFGVVRLIRDVEDCSYYDARVKFEAFRSKGVKVGSTAPPTHHSNREKGPLTPKGFKYPKGMRILDDLQKQHVEYLHLRRYDPYELVGKHHIFATDRIGDYKLRIVIPYFLNRRMVTFTTRDVTGYADIPYMTCPEPLEIVGVKDTFYNFDSIPQGGRAIIVEGVFDAWRLYPDAIAASGKYIGDSRLAMLAQKDVEKIIVAYDADAYLQARRVAGKISGVIDNVEIVLLDEGDPDDLSDSEARELRRMLND